ncbi:YjjW family glycine radical enzyme activase [Maledivibacter halophilus]|uniref:Glycine radical enzyme activase, YjjW family n=1 Tax=Maledivibacter halophilus TaxID=36842 RepID=A0A1T5LJP1_9FIRM|nr:YjjW family glycine radical enzyme activase [Maledivibacter halophilus]SKC76190.1 glycine radical enzyme activase, YjjW family [Maledivibacter halophilus]
MVKGLINRILPFSSVDGPGNRTAIFLQGCNFNCLYCHNPETINKCNNCGRCVEHCPYNALSYVDNRVVWNRENCRYCDKCLEICGNNSLPRAVNMTVDEVMKEIMKVKPFISGITVSGGECTLQSIFVTALFKRVKDIGLTTFLDTNGSISLYEEKELIKYMDMAMVDLKSYDNKEHNFLTGMDNEIVIENIKHLSKINKLYEVRTVIVPELLNNYYNVDMISKLIARLDPKIRYKLIKYRPMGVRTELFYSYQPNDETMNELHNLAHKNGCTNVILV